VKAWQGVALGVSGNSERYESAVRAMVAAMRDGNDEDVIDALRALDEADQMLGASMDQASSVMVNGDVSGSTTTEVLSQANRFSVDALELYLLVGSYVMAPEDEGVAVEDVERLAQAALSSLETYRDTLDAAAPTVDESAPLPIIRTVLLPNEASVDQPLEIAIAVQNIGSVGADEVVAQSRAMGHRTEEVDLGTLEAGQTQTTTVQFQAVQTGTMTLLTEVTTGGLMTDSRFDRVGIGAAQAEEPDQPWAGVCPGDLITLLTGIVLFVRRKDSYGGSEDEG
jgi:hypothetical protein